MKNPPDLHATTHSKLRDLESHLRERIRGQDHVITQFASLLQRGELGLRKPGRPRGSILFLGPTGVGKTEVTLTFTRYLLGEECLFGFDMSEYQNQVSLAGAANSANAGRSHWHATIPALVGLEHEKTQVS